MRNDIQIRVMIHYHISIQLFTTLLMWQGGPPPYFIFKTRKVVRGLPCHINQGGEKLYKNVAMNHYSTDK
jgi:hypothetical protein